ncbi:MAG: hypothetical protein JWQ28_2323 [Pedobacter sp.]|nr:hypothetical protein [Pedobacter sp.]
MALASIMLIYETKLRGRFHRRILMAFIFLFVGLIILQSEKATVYVLLCFFAAHICFVKAFYLDFSSAPQLDKATARLAIFLGILFSFTSYIYLRPYLGAFRIPALIYSFSMTLVIMMASFRRLRVNGASFVLILSASILLAATALIFAFNYFVASAEYNRIVIDAAFMLSIYLMVRGAVERKLLVLE